MHTRAQWYCLDCLTSFDVDLQSCGNLSCQAERPSKGWEAILQPNQILDRRFMVHKLLAIGGAGITYLVRELNDQDEEEGPRLAVKVLFTGRDSGAYLHRLSNEAQILEQMAHPHIIEYRGFSHISGRAPYLVTRFANGGSLMEHLREHGTLSVKSLFAIGAQICSALTEAHKLGVIHRDLKPDNILLAQKNGSDGPFHALIADFGIAKVETAILSQMTSMGTFVGTPNFAAPEQFLAQNITTSIDVYATCAMLYYAVTGQYVFKFSRRLGHSKIIETLMNSLPPKLPDLSATEEELEILQKIFHYGLQFDFNKRASLEQIFRWCVEGTELCFKESLDSNGPSSASPVVELIYETTSGGTIKPPLSGDDIYGQDPTVKPAGPSEQTNKPQSAWSIPSPDYTVIPVKEKAETDPEVENQQETIDIESLKADSSYGEATAAPFNDQEALQSDDDRQVDSLLEQIDKPSEALISQFSTVDIGGTSDDEQGIDAAKLPFADPSTEEILSDTSTLDFPAKLNNEIHGPAVDETNGDETLEASKDGKGQILILGLATLFVLAAIAGATWLMWPAGEPESPTSGPPGAVISPIDQADEVAKIQSKMAELSEGIQQRCKIEQGLVAMVVQLNDTGQVVQKVSSKSKGDVNIDCIYKVLKSKSFERRSSGLIEVKYQAKW